MKRFRIMFLVVSALAFALGSVLPAEATTTQNWSCGQSAYSPVYGYQYTTCLTITRDHRVVYEFDLTFTNNSPNKIVGHHQVWWCYSTGSPCTTIFNTAQRTINPNTGVLPTNCPWLTFQAQICETYPGWHYTFPQGAKLYDTFWQYIGSGNYKNLVQTPAMIINY